MANRWGKVETVADLIHMGSKVPADSDCSHEFKRHLFLRRKNIINLDTILKSRDITLPTKVPIVKGPYGFSSSHVWVCEVDHKEG